MTQHWAVEHPMCGLDLETTSLDPTEAVPVSAALTLHRGDRWDLVQDSPTLIDPGTPIPASTTRIHGITNAQARQGRPLHQALEDIVVVLERAQAQGVPVVGANIRYDLTVIEHNLGRAGFPTLDDLVPDLVVGDGMVLDRWWDRGRQGRRNLGALCAHYGIALERAHRAVDDAVAAVGLYRHLLLASGRCEQALGALGSGSWERARQAEVAACSGPGAVMELTGRWWAAHERVALAQGRRERAQYGWPWQPYGWVDPDPGQGLEYARGWWRANAGRLRSGPTTGEVVLDATALGVELARAFEAGQGAGRGGGSILLR